MENIKRACALDGVPVVAPVDTRTTQAVPFMQMTAKILEMYLEILMMLKFQASSSKER